MLAKKCLCFLICCLVFVIAFLLRSKRPLISWLQSLSAVTLEPKKIKYVTASTFPPSICHEVMGLAATILIFWLLNFKPAFSFSSFTPIKRLFSASPHSAFRVVSLYIWSCCYFSWKKCIFLCSEVISKSMMCFQIPSSVYYTFFKVIFPDWSKRDSWRFPGPCADLSLAPMAALSHVYCVPLKHIVEKYLLTLNLLLFLAYGWRTSIGPFNKWKNENGISDTFWNPSLISVVCLFLPSSLPFLLKTILNRNIHLLKKYTELFYRLNYMKLSYQKKKILAPIFLNFNHLKNF